MSGLHDYNVAKQIYRTKPPFDALIMAAAMRADSANFAKLLDAFPDLVNETSKRHNAPGGRLPDEIDPPKACRNCGTSYDECTRALRSDDRACCGACRTTATHEQNAWERMHGARTTEEVRG